MNRALKGLLLNRANFALTRCDRGSQFDHLDEFFRRVAPVSTEHPLIRIGNANDGGYLVPDDLDGIRSCYSPGVSNMVDFEMALTRRGINCQLADYSVAAPPCNDPLIHFEKRYLGCVNDATHMRLADWVARTADPLDTELLLQMDIEGGEYDVLIDSPIDLLARFRIVVIEFHSLEALFTPLGFRLINSVLAKLLSTFRLVHIHPNNCFEWQWYGPYRVPTVMEFTFHRADRISTTRPTRHFPHQLDGTNVPAKPDFSLPHCWYSAG